MTTLYLDTETYSATPISYGTHRYAEDAEVMLVAWAVDDGPVTVVDCTAGDAWYYANTFDTVVMHNSAFDRTVLRHASGLDLPVANIHDTMAMALAHSLPGSLDTLCDILRVPFDKAKAKDGRKLINLFCKPHVKKGVATRATRETHPAEWAAFIDYARLDVEAMREVYRKLPRWNLTDSERALWALDQAINDRGVAIDTDLVDAAIRTVDAEQARLAERTHDLTDGHVASATQRDALKDYIEAAFDLKLDDMTGATLEGVLAGADLHPDLRDLLTTRLAASTTSTAKYKSLRRSVSRDGRLRGTLQFCGASRTGRWAGRLFQPQNLKRQTLPPDEIEAGIGGMKAGCADLIAGDVMDLAANALRGCIVAPPGRKLVVADLSNIEGRVLAWLAGEAWKVQAFADFDKGVGHDLYKLAYARSFGVEPDAVSKDQRQVGKVQELALGYQGGAGAFITFAAVYGIDLDAMAEGARKALPAWAVDEAASVWDWVKQQKRPTFGLARDTWIACDGVKRAWRAAHPATVALWRAYERAAETAIFGGDGACVPAPRVAFRRSGAWLRIELPSGRSLSYPAPRADDRGKLTYRGVNQYTRRWERLSTYGGKIVENSVQAIARDVLAHGMKAAERKGYRIVLSVHDELIAETPDDPKFSAGGLAAIMSANPPWAMGLPLAAAGFEATRYRKG